MALFMLLLIFATYFVGEIQSNMLNIVGGDVIPIEDAPYMVSLRADGIHVCGGSIVNTEFVLTSVQCIKRNAKYTVVAGTNDIEYTGEEFEILRMHTVNNSYKIIGNDIALIKLAKPIQYGPKIKKVNLPKEGLDVEAGTQVNITGWGYTKRFTGGYSQKLRRTSVEVLEREDCTSTIDEILSNNEFCSGTVRKSICKGDEGGPVTVNGVQVGIISRTASFTCQSPNINTNVAMFKSWIEHIINTDV